MTEDIQKKIDQTKKNLDGKFNRLVQKTDEIEKNMDTIKESIKSINTLPNAFETRLSSCEGSLNIIDTCLSDQKQIKDEIRTLTDRALHREITTTSIKQLEKKAEHLQNEIQNIIAIQKQETSNMKNEFLSLSKKFEDICYETSSLIDDSKKMQADINNDIFQNIKNIQHSFEEVYNKLADMNRKFDYTIKNINGNFESGMFKIKEQNEFYKSEIERKFTNMDLSISEKIKSLETIKTQLEQYYDFFNKQT